MNENDYDREFRKIASGYNTRQHPMTREDEQALREQWRDDWHRQHAARKDNDSDDVTFFGVIKTLIQIAFIIPIVILTVCFGIAVLVLLWMFAAGAVGVLLDWAGLPSGWLGLQ